MKHDKMLKISMWPIWRERLLSKMWWALLMVTIGSIYMTLWANGVLK